MEKQNRLHLNPGEIFFGFVNPDGTRSSMLEAPLSCEKLQLLWKKYPELFSHRCDDGSTAYIYGHTISINGKGNNIVGSVLFLVRPSDGTRITLGANIQRSRIRIETINAELKRNL